MKHALAELAARRARLVAEAARDRDRLDACLGRADVLMSWAVLWRRLLDEVRRRPLLVAAVAAIAFVIRPKRMLQILASGWSLWQVYARARSLLG